MTAIHQPATVLGAEVEGIADDLTGIHPTLDRILTDLQDLATEAVGDRQLTADVLLALAGDGPNITSMIAEIITALGNPRSNPAVAGLPAGRAQDATDCTAQYALFVGEFAPRGLVTEAVAAIHGSP